MKIFPPISELLWPPEHSLSDLLRTRGLPVLFVAIGAALVWSIAPAPHKGGRSAGRQATIENCSELITLINADTVTAQPCRSVNTPSTRQHGSGKPLARGNLEPRPHQLTDADRAIRAPGQTAQVLRPAIWNRRATTTAPGTVTYAPDTSPDTAQPLR